MRYKLLLIGTLLLLCSFTEYRVAVENEAVLAVSDSICNSQMGLRERTGKNDGVHITKYMNYTHLSGNKGYPYCAAGQAWCLGTACDMLGIKFPFTKKSAVANFYFDDAKKHGVEGNGMIAKHKFVIWKAQSGNTGHIERVHSVIDAKTATVMLYAFNTSNGLSGSQNNGNGNYLRKRTLKSFLGRLRLRGLVSMYEPKIVKLIDKDYYEHVQKIAGQHFAASPNMDYSWLGC